jgi:hypothetical protein
MLWILDNGLIHTYIHFFIVNAYLLYIETLRPNTNIHVYAPKYLYCAGIEPTISCVVGEYSHLHATSAIKLLIKIYFFIGLYKIVGIFQSAFERKPILYVTARQFCVTVIEIFSSVFRTSFSHKNAQVLIKRFLCGECQN